MMKLTSTTDSDSVYSLSFFSLIIVGLITTGYMLIFYNHAKKTALEEGRINQKIRIESVARRLETFSIISTQLSKFIQTNINYKILSPIEIEKKLAEFIQSAPHDTIYGIGIWHEPFTLDKKRKYFGPYIHRDITSVTKTKLTYEWEVPSYNYHEQDWYTLGIKAQGEGVFIKPYFDAGLVYVTLTRAFFKKNNEVAGIITVDMILPQLQEIINSINTTPEEQIYITTNDQFLLAHPLEKILKIKDSILSHKIDEINDLAKIDKKDWVKKSLHIPLLEWNVNIESSPHYLLEDVHSLKSILITATFILWSVIFVLIWIVKNYIHQKIIFASQNENNRLQLIQSSKMAALGEMASGLAHEINNPLSIINGRIDRALRILPANDHEAITNELIKIKKTTLRISKIISSLKTFARAAENDNFTNEDIITIISDVKELSEDKLKTYSIDLEVNIHNTFHLDCRPTQIVQVLVNLINNACDAIINLPEKWIRVDVSITDDQKAQIAVTDSGHLVDQKIISKLMEPFFTTKEVGKGTGLGLSISHSIIAEHLGEFSFDRKASNTTFIIRLPLYQKSTLSKD